MKGQNKEQIGHASACFEHSPEQELELETGTQLTWQQAFTNKSLKTIKIDI